MAHGKQGMPGSRSRGVPRSPDRSSSAERSGRLARTSLPLPRSPPGTAWARHACRAVLKGVALPVLGAAGGLQTVWPAGMGRAGPRRSCLSPPRWYQAVGHFQELVEPVLASSKKFIEMAGSEGGARCTRFLHLSHQEIRH